MLSDGPGMCCAGADRAGAEKALGEYIAAKHTPFFGRGDPSEVSVIDVLLLYSQERAPQTVRPEMVDAAVLSLGEFWKGRKIANLDPVTCAAYVKWRTARPQARFKDPLTAPRVGAQTARRELETLSAAIGFAYRSRKLNYVVPVALPQKSESRDRWLSRNEVARALFGNTLSRDAPPELDSYYRRRMDRPR